MIRVLFLEFHHFVIKLVIAYKELSLLKFGSGDFIFSPCWNHRIDTKNHDYLCSLDLSRSYPQRFCPYICIYQASHWLA
jgi:hypothetical protein